MALIVIITTVIYDIGGKIYRKIELYLIHKWNEYTFLEKEMGFKVLMHVNV